MFEGSTTNHRYNIPGSLSLVSKHNNNELLEMIRNVWQFDHDVDDHYLPNISQERYLDNSSSNTQPLRACSNEQVSNNMESKNHHLDESQQGQNLYPGQTLQLPMNNPNKKIDHGISSCRKYRKYPHPNDQITGNQQNLENQNKNQEKQQTNSTPSLECKPEQNRQLEIYSHKYKSNIGYTITQLREILKYNYLASLNSELQHCRKNIMKLQIQCRKLRIGLRSVDSQHKMMEKKKKFGNLDHSKKCKQRPQSRSKTRKKNDRLSSDYLTNQFSTVNSKYSARYSKLYEEIASKKRETQYLGTRQTLTTNYYNALKARCNQKTLPNKPIQSNQNNQASFTFNPYSLPPQSIVKKDRKTRNSTFQSPSSELDIELSKYNLNDQQLILLHIRKQIVLVSSQTSKEHYQKKISQLEEEIKLMRKHKDVIDHQINSPFCLRKESLQSVRSPIKRGAHKKDSFATQFFSSKKYVSSTSLRSFIGYTENLKKKRSSQDKRMTTKDKCLSYEVSNNGVSSKTNHSLNKVEPLKQFSLQRQYLHQTPTEQYFISGSLRKIE